MDLWLESMQWKINNKEPIAVGSTLQVTSIMDVSHNIYTDLINHFTFCGMFYFRKSQ